AAGTTTVSLVCDASGSADAALPAPRPAEGPAVDPVTLPEVDEVTITTLVDNVFDGLLPSGGAVTRPSLGSTGHVPAPQFSSGWTVPGLRAEHGFSALGTARRGEPWNPVLVYTGA